MKDDEIDPIEPSLGALFVEERTHGRAPAGSRERVFERLATSIGPGDGGGGTGGSGGPPLSALGQARRLLPVIASLVVGTVTGGLVATKIRPPRIVYVDRVVHVYATAAPPGSQQLPPEPPPALSASPVAAGAPTAPTSSASRDVALAKERSILDVARTALGRNDGAHALEAVDRHAREFPQGQMTEEREAIGVQALVKLGRTHEASVRGARFRGRYPNSVLMDVIDAALPGEATSKK